MKITSLLAIGLFLSTITSPLESPAYADVELDDEGKLSAYGDFRGRIETDWQSQKGDGANRADRTRIRYRARLGIKVKPIENFKFDARIRSSADDSQQIPQVTILDFDDNDTGPSGFNFDKYYALYTYSGLKAWFGRNAMPFWQQSSFFWSEDVTPVGAALSYQHKCGDSSILANTGYFSNPAGMKAFTGNTAIGQIVLKTKLDGNQFTLAAGLIDIFANPDDSDNELLLDGNGSRDYQTWIGSAQVALPIAEDSLKLGFDYARNTKSYSENNEDTFTSFHRDEKNGYIISAEYGKTDEKGDFLLGTYYTYVETFAINSSYSPAEWIRWGTVEQARATNLKGPQVFAGLGFGNNINVIFRLYLMRAIKARESGQQKEDGKRVRIDVNWKF